jgi:hypothetical protein
VAILVSTSSEADFTPLSSAKDFSILNLQVPQMEDVLTISFSVLGLSFAEVYVNKNKCSIKRIFLKIVVFI